MDVSDVLHNIDYGKIVLIDTVLYATKTQVSHKVRIKQIKKISTKGNFLWIRTEESE